MTNKKFKTILKKSSLLAGAMALSFGIIALNFNDEDPYFSNYRGNYESDLAYIKEATVPTNNKYVTMSAAAGGTVPTAGQKISIATFDELILFSNTLNGSGNEAFLGYNYELIANIQCTSLRDFTPVGYKTGYPFSGTFNGNGYEITNLHFANNVPTGMSYYSMFSVNTGTIENVGLSYPTIVISSPTADLMAVGGVSYLVGKNQGTLKNSFVIDDANIEKKDTAGITANDSRISVLCVDNAGTLDNNYVAVDLVVDSQSTYAEFAEITLTNSSQDAMDDNYYFNNSIAMVSGTRTVYKDSTGLPDKTTSLGTYELTKDSLVGALDGVTGAGEWYTASSYGDLAAYVPIEYGVMRGLTYDNSSYIFTVANDKDYAYMYELFNSDDYLASNRITYNITADIDLKYQPVASYTYKKGIGASIIGATISGSTKLITNNMSTSPTIYNAKVMDESRIAKSVGVDCYGLFNFVTGTIKNLNVYAGEISLNNISTSSNNVKGVGILAGYIESGHIENVNVYGEIKKTNSSDIKEYYLGGITGILGGAGVIMNSTAAGSIELAAMTTTLGAKSAYMKGVAIGGIAGYLESSLGNVYGATSAVDISTMLGSSSVEYAIGGIIGAGYTTNYNYVDSNDFNQHNKTANLENLGDITVGDSTHKTYSTLYVSGIIGRHLGATAQVENFNNAGVITVCTNANETYVSGVENVDFKSSAVDNTGMTASQYKDKAGKTIFYASSLTNGNNVIVSDDSSVSNNLNYTNVINIKAGNGVVSQVQGLFNLSYNKQYNTSGNKVSGAIDAQEININLVKNFAPVLNVVGGTSTYTTTASMVYNLRDVTFDTSANVTTAATYKYAGVALGDYVSYEDVRNEGNLTFTLDNAFTSNLIVSGLFDVVSSKMKANNLYNGGNINVDFTANVTGNIYSSGICYANRNGFTDAEILTYNPTDDTFNNENVGSINNAINNGNILITNENFSSITYSKATYWDSAASGVQMNVYGTSFSGATISGNVYISGVTNVNESVITNAFNLGNISAFNYLNSTSTTYQIVSSGIANLAIGKFAYISNSANNGDIFAVNLSNGTYTSGSHVRSGNTTSTEVSAKTIYKSDVTAAGIVGRNDSTESGVVGTSNNNSRQVISFTINYGSVVGYNFAENIGNNSSNLTSKSAGIIGVGLSTVVNVLNYGNVFGSEVVGGIFGAIYVSYYSSEISSAANVYISNTINYGNVSYLAKGYSDIPSEVDNKYLTYSNLYSAIGDANAVFDGYSTFSLHRTIAYYLPTEGTIEFLSYAGGVYGFINYNEDTKSQYILIRYLLTFNSNISIAGAQIDVPDSVTTDVSTIYSCYTSIHTTGTRARDIYMDTYVNYAPLDASEYSIEFMQTYGDSVSKATISGYGLFASDFIFRRVIEGEFQDGSTYYNTNTYITDRFLTDYFQFASYKYVNSNLMDKIGWKTLAYIDAANTFANSLYGMNLFFEKYKTINSSNYSTILTEALETNNWSSYANVNVLYELIDELVDNDDLSSMNSLLDLVFSDSNVNAVFTNSFRTKIVDYIINKYPNIFNNDLLISFVNHYSSILAEVLSGSDSNDVKDYVTNQIDDYLTTLSSSKEELLLSYVDYLSNYGEAFFNGTLESARYTLLMNLFSEISDDDFYDSLYGLFSSDSKYIIDNFVSSLSALGGYNILSASEKTTLFSNIISNNNESKIATYLDSFASEIGLFNELQALGYNITSFSDMTTKINSDNTTTTNQTDITNRVALWNQIKDTTTFTTYFNSLLGNTKKYYVATEYNNTYQTTRNPDIPSTQYLSNGYGHSPMDSYAGTPNDLMYFYEDNVTESTYFLGPYVNSSGSTISLTRISGKPSSATPSTNTNIGTATGVYVSLVIYDSDAVTGLKSVYSNANNAVNANYEAYYNQKGRSQFSNSTALNSDGAFTLLKENNYTLVYNKQSYSLNRAYVKTNTSGNLYLNINGTDVTVSGNCTINGTSYNRTNARNFIINNLTIPMYCATVNTNWHSTGYTGLYMYKENWNNASNNSNHCLVFDGNSKYSVIRTTRYIDYSSSQLLALDGYRTRVSSEVKPTDSDEQSIINDIFNTILLTSSNKANFLRVVKKALLEKVQTFDTDNVFLDGLVNNNINSSIRINSLMPLEYLTYSGTTSVLEYLSDKNSSQGYKQKIISAAAGDMDVFVELMQLLFNETKTIVATGPGQGVNYGSSLDVDKMINRLNYMYQNSQSDSVSPYLPATSIQNSNAILQALNYAPLTVANEVDAATYTGSNAKETPSSQNLGYYLGNQNKTYSMSIKFTDQMTVTSDSAKTTYDWDKTNKYTPMTFFKRTGQNATTTSENIVAMTAEEIAELPEGIRNILPSTSGTVTRSAIRLMQKYEGTAGTSTTDASKMGLKSEISYCGTPYTNVQLPNNGIWFKPVNIGTFRFVIYTGGDGSNFSLYECYRSNYSSSAPFANGHSTADFLDNSLYSKSLPSYCLLYFEYDVTEKMIKNNVEFVIGNNEGSNGAYILYLDIGTSGSETTEEITSTVQTAVGEVSNYDDELDEIINYLTPLEGLLNNNSYQPITYNYSLATEYDSNETYYARVLKDGVYKYKAITGVNSTNYSDYYVATANKTIEDYQNLLFNGTFKELLAKTSNNALKQLIKSLYDKDDITDVIKKMIGENSNIFNSIISNRSAQIANDAAYKQLLAAGYYASDYYKNTNRMSSTLLNTLLQELPEGYRYITGATTINNDKFEAFCEYIGYPLSNMGFGIYALASNKGIKNGVFIPDNLDITTMDDKYSSESIGNASVLMLRDVVSSEWRGGDDSVADTTSVNYAFFVDMKQISQSISTTVFEFDINYGGATIFGDIDQSNKTITFYVPSISAGTYTITTARFAEGATSTKNVDDTITVASTTSGAVQTTFVVTAQNTSVTSTYKVIFKTVDVDFTLKYSDNTTAKTQAAFTTDSTLVLKLTSTEGQELPTGLNLEPYISFVGTSATYKPGDENGYISLSSSSVDHVVDASGNATITIIVSPKLPHGTYNITVSFVNESSYVSYTKGASLANAITAIQYQGQDLEWSDKVATTTIPFGRAFNYTDLTAIYLKTTDTSINSLKTYYTKTGNDVFSYKKVVSPVVADIGNYYELNDDFYLNVFEVSYNATVSISATKSTSDSTGLMTYSVEFTITSESGVSTKYTHKLVESNYFADATYANLYADGDDVKPVPANYSSLTETERVVYLKSGTFTYDHTKDDFNGNSGSSLADDMQMYITYNRGVEPQYRVKYVLNNFYTLGENVVFGPTSATTANGATVNNTYAGLTVTVSNNNDVGKYVFVYTYKNTGVWDGGVEYTRYYEFPELVIEKLASTDALLKNITFLEEAVSLGNTATVILPNKVLVPSMSGTHYASDDEVYTAVFQSTEREINVSHSGIEYGDADSTDISDYFIIGTVSNADLSYYCPTYAIERHAQMYQYTTKLKLTSYGTGVQTTTDKAILANHNDSNTTYLYVPFNSSTSHEVFLVELDSNDNWTNVFRTTYNGSAEGSQNYTSSYVGTFTGTVNAKNHNDATVAGYTVCDYAGKPTNNDSLYMDYVGTPLEGHFWYVSYVIFSEDKLEGGTLAGNVRYYHISVIDLTNNIQFYVKVYAPSDFTLTDIYLTISENIYDKTNTKTDSRQISAYAVDSGETATRSDISGYKIYTLSYDLQTLPGGYFYFFVDLPDGYVAKSYTSMENRLKSTDAMYQTEKGAFLPYESIITQKVNLEIIINKGTGENDSAWAISTSDIYIKQTEYSGTIISA